ncbi:leucine-rich_repeat domain-containing protein [Hexamita inflata]|uniref:Leucine-rich repeat domain-containing protein n=1 Tax=Hexamita inflata TaxID=28002 RepID=A0AA86TNW3_9EUKA|nr:leucine-rich repeat domain-containing protein [Hexamita inflata]
MNDKNTLKEPSDIFLDISLFNQILSPEKASQQFEMCGFPKLEQLDVHKQKLQNKYNTINDEVIYQDIIIQLKNQYIEKELEHDNDRLNECQFVAENCFYSKQWNFIGIFKDKIIINQHFDGLRTFQFVDHFQKTELSLENCSTIRFERTPKTITKLILFGCLSDNLEGIQKMTQLISLEISHGDFDLSPLKQLINLASLSLSGKVNSIDALQNLKKLTYVSLSDSELVDIYPLQKLANLKSLYLSGNQIFDIYALSRLARLERLDLRYNEIFDITPLKNLKNLTSLNVESNYIRDFEPLKDLNIEIKEIQRQQMYEAPRDIIDKFALNQRILGPHKQIVQLITGRRKLQIELQQHKQRINKVVQRAFQELVGFTGVVSGLFQQLNNQ